MKEKIHDLVYNFRSINKYGLTVEELLVLLKKLKIAPEVFNEKFGEGNTCAFISGRIVMYHCDIELAIICCLENREKTFEEWD